MKPLLIGSIVACAALVGGDAFAQYGGYRYRDERPRAAAGAPRYVPPENRTCIKMCSQDNLPCDPIYFKRADGRCSGFDR